MRLFDALRRWWRPTTLARAERERAACLGVYFIEAEGFDRGERGRFTRVVAVCLNAAEAAERLQHPPREAHWEDVEYRRWGPRPLLGLVEGHTLDAAAARALLARAGRGEAHELLPAPLSPKELRQAESIEVWLIWYEDKFHYGIERDSFAISACLSRAEAEEEYRREGRQPPPEGGDGYEIVGPVGLHTQPPEVAREVLRRRQAGEAGPVPIPSIYW